MFTRFSNLRLRWKILSAPAFLILVLIGLGAFALHTQRTNQATIDALILGPVAQAEAAADFSTAIWAAQARFYLLTDTSTNETDDKKIKAMATQTSTTLTEVAEKLKALESIRTGTGKTAEILDKLKASVASYMKQANSGIEMADGDAGSALMFMTSAERSFVQIEKLTDEITYISKDLRDQEIARANAKLGEQTIVLAGIVLVAVLVGGFVSFLVAGGIARPVVRIAEAIKRIAQGDFDVAIPAMGQRDEIGVIAGAVGTLKASSHEAETLRREQESAKSRSEAERKIMLEGLAAE